MTPSMLARFEAKVHPEPNTGCWLWRGAIDPNGYGGLGGERRGRTTMRYYAHRLAYEHFVGPIPDGMVLDHVRARGCCGPSCCNPAHLEPVTHAENMRRGAWAQRSHCPAGHAYSADNVSIIRRPPGWRGCPDGWTERRCKTCARERARKSRT